MIGPNSHHSRQTGNTPSGQGQPSDFPASQASEAMAIARLPETYERVLEETGDPEKARAAMLREAPASVRDHITVVRSNNTTAIVAYDPQKGTATVAFDPTRGGGNILTNADQRDNLLRGETDHPLGGQVHGGLYRDMVDPGTMGAAGRDMIDTIQGVVHDYASQNGHQINVTFAGFSKGGAQSVLAAGEMMSRGFFDEGQGIHMSGVFTFGSPGYGNDEFIKAFENKARELGVNNIWAVGVHGDPTPTILTPNGPGMFTRYNYGQVGRDIYIIPGQAPNSQSTVIVDPSAEQLQKLRDLPSPGTMHRSSVYSDAVNRAQPMQDMTPVAPVPEPRPLPQTNFTF